MIKGSIALISGNMITMENENAREEAVLIENGQISAVGKSRDIESLAGEKNIPVVDLNGKTVLPGLHDCHVHVMGTGSAKAGIDLYNAKDIAEVIALLKEGASKFDGWIIGVRLDESRLSEKRPPTMTELSGAFPNIGVMLQDRGLHYTVINQKAYDEIGFAGNELGMIKNDAGQPTGRMKQLADHMVRGHYDQIKSDVQRQSEIDLVSQEAVSKGITTIHGMEGGPLFSDHDIPCFLNMPETCPVDYVLYWDNPEIDPVIDAGLPRIGTDILSDGSIGSRTAAFDEPYADGSGCGELYFTPEQMTAMIEKSLKHKLQFGYHAIGQKAIRQVIDCYEQAFEKYPGEDTRFRMEHFGFCDPRDIERAKAHQMIISTQPAFSYLRGGPDSVYQIRTGEARERKAYPTKALLDQGLICAGGSDSPVTPMDALLGIHSAVNHPYPEHRVSLYQALRMFTIDGAYAAFEEKEKGSIEPGKRGDLVVLKEDPYQTDPEKLKDIQVCMTIKDGTIVWESSN